MLRLATIRVAAIGSAIVCLSACDGSDSGQSLPISVAFAAPPPTTVAANGTASLSAVVANDHSLSGVSWTATCATAPCGTFSPASTGSGVQTAYTAPGLITSALTVTLTATSTTDSSKKASTTITVTPPPKILTDGKYVYHYAGQNDDGPFTVTGVFIVDDGQITGGEQDYSDANGVAADTLVPATSSFSATGNTIQIVLDTGDDDVGDDGVETLRGSIVSAKRVLISEFDDGATGTGSLDAQDDDDSQEQPDGSYAFAVNGHSAAGNQLAIGGVLSFDDGDLSVADSVLDVNELTVGTQTAQTFDSGSVSAPDEFGRVTITLEPSAASNVPAFTLTGYIVDDDKIQLLTGQPDDLAANLGGTALSQGDSAGAFDDDDVADTKYVHASLGADSNSAVVAAGVFTLNADNTLDGTLTINDGTTHASVAIPARSTWALEPTGRVTLAGAGGVFEFELYLNGEGSGLILSLNPQAVTAGLAFQRVAPSSEIEEGTYAVAANGVTWGAVGQAKIDDGDVDGSVDYTPQGDDSAAAVPLSGSIDAQNGTLSLAGLNAKDTDTAEDFAYYPIDENRTIAVEVSGQQLGLVWLEATNAEGDNGGGGGDDDDDD
jgi:autotransporter-associated beta strand protein